MPLFTDPPAPYPDGWAPAEIVAAGRDAGSVDRLMAELDGARFVKYDPDGYVWAWFGGHGVHAYDATGREVDYCTVGDQSVDHATLLEVEEGINGYIAGL